MERVRLGEVVKPQGIKGEIKTKLFDTTFDCKSISKIIIDSHEYTIESVRKSESFLFFKLNGVDNFADAEKLRGKTVFLTEQDALDNLKENEFYADHIMGYKVVAEDITVGILFDIQNFGGSDIFYIKDNNSNMCLIPFVKGIIENIDEKNKTINLNKKRFLEVAVYEDWYINTFSRNVFGTSNQYSQKGSRSGSARN
mgnify:FL=1